MSKNVAEIESEKETEGDYPFTVVKSYHTKRCIDIWVLRLKKNFRLTREDYNKLKEEVKLFDGYYSFPAKGFIFEAEPSKETLEEFAKMVEIMYSDEREAPVENLNYRPISKETNRQFNAWRLFDYGDDYLNDDYERTLKSMVDFVKEKTGLDYAELNQAPLVLEALKYFAKALKELQERSASANTTFPNPYATGMSGYKNIERKKQRAQAIMDIGLEKIKKSRAAVKRALNRYLKEIEIKNIPSIDFQRDELNKKIGALRKEFRGKVEYIRKYNQGSRNGKKYSDYEIKFGDYHIEAHFHETGLLSLTKNLFPVGSLNYTSLDDMLKYVKKMISHLLNPAEKNEKLFKLNKLNKNSGE